MTGRLLERDAELGLLQAGLRQAGRGRGSVVLVSGEAGIGKTSLVRAFDKVRRETLYFAEPFAAPDWRRPWAEEVAAEAHGGLPALVHGGS
jgi:AAA ATPase domain